MPGGVPSFYNPVELFARQNPGILALATVQLIFLNHNLFGFVLQSTTRAEGAAAKWLRAGRFALAAIPLLGLYVLSLGRWTTGKQPFWFLATHGQRLTPPLLFLDGRLVLNLMFNLLVFQGWTAYLSPITGRALLSNALHGLALLAAQVDVLVTYRRAFISLRRGTFLALLSILWFFSFPLWGLGWLGHLLLINTAPRPRHRMREFFKGRFGLHERLDESVRLDWWKASRWRLWRTPFQITDPAADRDEEEVVPLYRLKTFLTVFEATGAIILLVLISQRSPAVASVVVPTLLVTIVCSIGIATLGFLVLICNFLARFLGGPLFSEQAQAVIKYLALNQTGMLVGIYMGLYLIQGDMRRLGFLLTGAGFLAALVTFLLALPPLQPNREKVKKHDIQLLFWMAIFAVSAAAGVAIRTSEILAYHFKLLMILFLVLTPVFALGASLTLGRRLRTLLPSRPSLALRGASVFCLLTAFLPLGGLAIPLWIRLRRRLLVALFSLVDSDTQPSSAGEKEPAIVRGLLLGHLRIRESSDYFFSNVISHLAAAGERQKIYELLEGTRFLQDQLAHFGAFGKSSDDVEIYVVPLAIEECDWNRFIHFMLLALHLRGTTEDLFEFIEPLARSGQVSMALDAVNRIASPLDRSGAKAMIASQLPPDSETYHKLLQSIPLDLASLPPLTTDPTLAGPMTEKQYWASVVIAQAFGLAAREPLTQFLANRPAWWSDVIWINMAQHHAEQHGLLDSELWLALRNLQDLALLKEYLPEQLMASADLPHPEAFLACVEGLSDDPELSWLCRFTLLNAIARTSAEQAILLWQRWSAERPVCWTLQVAEQAAPFLSTLESQRIQDLVQSAEDPEVRVALLLVLFSRESPTQRIEETARAIEDIPTGARRFHWQVHVLRLRARNLRRSEIREEIAKLTRSLRELAYETKTADLRSLFELIATYFPEKLEQEMKGAFWAPSTIIEALVEIVDTTESAALLAHFLEKVDHYLLPFRPGEAEGFQAWCGLLQKIVPRLCALTGKLSYLDRAIELNSDQADELRTVTVKALIDAKALDLAKHVCNSITSRRQRYLTRLKMSAVTDPEILNQASLFEAFAGSEMLLDEISGLQALAASGGTPPPFLTAQVCRINSHQEQFLALLRRVERELSRPHKRDRQNDMLDRLIQAAGLVTSNVQLAALTPEITAIVASHSERQTVLEIREALERLLSLRSVPWPVRRDICETLLSRHFPLLAARAEGGRSEATEIVRMIAGLLEWIEYGSNQEIEERGILPVLFAVMDRLPLPVLKRFLRQLPSEGFFPALYVADDSDLGGILDRMIEEDRFDPLILETVLYLFAYRLPDLVPEILADLTSGPFRDAIAAALLRHGWFPTELAPEVLPLIEDSAVRMSTELFLGLACKAGSQEEETWLYTLASLLVHQLVDPTDPRNEPWLRKLWTIDPERSRPILAQGVLKTLTQAGRWPGMSAFCLWLHAHLAPDAGGEPAEVLALCTEAEQVVQTTLKLPGTLGSTNA
jgi:hypothetical protein